ncbi:hypothetical protein L207DRAFT_510538 [Hyaloscypha variabilis F]|uniref:Uncharacterized protein n=1 Tax=Hyaloscypha variabilis (strain UAMH 11265 / GT02V1 / F) TaxID=1149755 RepID=A0A2J6RUX9_HYAVF|nr:hypothetical protein L207DRAFT_510538 [Hyaloscypha variabilis F]
MNGVQMLISPFFVCCAASVALDRAARTFEHEVQRWWQRTSLPEPRLPRLPFAEKSVLSISRHPISYILNPGSWYPKSWILDRIHAILGIQPSEV